MSALDKAVERPNQPLPDLSSVASPAVVAAEQAQLQQLVQHGVHLQPSPGAGSTNILESGIASDTTAYVTTCSVNNWWTVENGTGQVINTVPLVDTSSWTLARQPNGSWIITATKLVSRTPGATKCPASTGH